MICPSRKVECDNSACRRWGCQGGLTQIFFATVRNDMRMFFLAAWLSIAPFVAAFADSAPPVIPDPTLTPGVVASTDISVVCAKASSGTYSQQHRLTTEAMKKQIFAEYGMSVPTAADRGNWEIDHRLPLCAGGADDIHNLWPQSALGPFGFHVKDRLEAYACREVCAGQVPLATAQGWFLAPDWRLSYCSIPAFADDKNCPPK